MVCRRSAPILWLLKAGAGAFLYARCWAASAAEGDAHGLTFQDADGDTVAILRGSTGHLNLYGNGELVMEHVTDAVFNGRNLNLSSRVERGEALTSVPRGQEAVLGRVQALLKGEREREARELAEYHRSEAFAQRLAEEAAQREQMEQMGQDETAADEGDAELHDIQERVRAVAVQAVLRQAVKDAATSAATAQAAGENPRAALIKQALLELMVEQVMTNDEEMHTDTPIDIGIDAPVELTSADGEAGHVNQDAQDTDSSEDVVSFQDFDGDFVSFRRKGGLLELHANGEVAVANISYVQQQGYEVLLRSSNSASKFPEALIRVPKGDTETSSRLAELFRRHRRAQAAKESQAAGAPSAPAPSGGASSKSHDTAELQESLKERWRQKVAEARSEPAHASSDGPRFEVRQVDSKQLEELLAQMAGRQSGGGKGKVRVQKIGIIQEEALKREEDAGETEEDMIDNVAKDAHRSIRELNRFNFGTAVLQENGARAAEHWVVLFCYHWHAPCHHIMQPFANRAATWQTQLNTALFTQEVRFAHVDCATDRVLCNEREVEGFPHVQHYSGGELIAKWNGGRSGDEARLDKWLKKQLSPGTPAVAANVVQAGDDDDMESLLDLLLGGPTDTVLDAFIVLVLFAWWARVICQNHALRQQAPQAQPQRQHRQEVNRAREAEKLAEGVIATYEEPAPDQPAAPAKIGRLLPSEWAQGRGAMDL